MKPLASAPPITDFHVCQFAQCTAVCHTDTPLPQRTGQGHAKIERNEKPTNMYNNEL